jgi:hypothetical protein
VRIEASKSEIVEKLNELKDLIADGKLKHWEFRGLKAVVFDRHLYQPLLFLDNNLVEISPTPLNRGESRFVEDLLAFHETHPDFFARQDLYLLRNRSRGRGIGFFEAGNFHPDFILWQVRDGRQRVVFVDPKGLRHVPLTDPRIGFHQKIKEIEHRLGDDEVSLESFIVSPTPAEDMERQWGISRADMKRQHVLFQDDIEGGYVRALLQT